MMKTSFTNSVYAIIGTTTLIVLGTVHAGPPPQPTDSSADRWVQDVQGAYADTKTYQSTAIGSITVRSGASTPTDDAPRLAMNTQIALNRPERKLAVRVDVDMPSEKMRIEKSVIHLVSDGKKLRMRSASFQGHHLEIDTPDPLDFEAISGLLRGAVSPAVAIELRLLLNDRALSDLATDLPARLRDAAHEDLGTPSQMSLVFTGPTDQCALRIEPDRRLVDQIRIEDSNTITQYSIQIDKHNQPIDDSLFVFDTNHSTPVDTMEQLIGAASPRAAAAPPGQGQDAPPIELKTLDGQPFKLDDVDAKVVILDFWATWCPPCRQGLPLLQRFHEWAESNQKSVAVYTVNLQETPETVRGYWEEAGFTMPVLMDVQGDVAQAYQVQGIPQTVMIHNGKVASVRVGFSPDLDRSLQAEVEGLFNDPPGDE